MTYLKCFAVVGGPEAKGNAATVHWSVWMHNQQVSRLPRLHSCFTLDDGDAGATAAPLGSLGYNHVEQLLTYAAGAGGLESQQGRG